MARNFAGTSYVEVTVAEDLSAYTMAFVCKLSGAQDLFGGIMSFRTGATERYNLRWDASSPSKMDLDDQGGFNADSVFATDADSWQLLGITKVAGSATPRFHMYVYDTGTWTHGAGSGAIGDQGTAGTVIRLCSNGSGNTLGDVACMGYWIHSMGDGEFERLTDRRWGMLGAKGFWDFGARNGYHNASSMMRDRGWARADQTSKSGTMAISTTQPPGPRAHRWSW